MIQELNQQIKEIKELIKVEEKSLSEAPDFLKKMIAPKKQSIIESLNKQIVKLQAEISKIESKQKNETDKEQREAPYKKIISDINNLKMTVLEKEKILAQAKGAYQTNRDQNKSAELNLKYKQANDEYFKTKVELENKITECKVLKENMKGSK